MSSGEFLLTAFIALMVFGPAKLPMLAHHLARLMSVISRHQQSLAQFWQAQLNEHQLQENRLKAKVAEDLSQKDTINVDGN